MRSKEIFTPSNIWIAGMALAGVISAGVQHNYVDAAFYVSAGVMGKLTAIYWNRNSTRRS